MPENSKMTEGNLAIRRIQNEIQRYSDFLSDEKRKNESESTLKYGGRGAVRRFLYGATKAVTGEKVADNVAQTFRNKSETEEAYKKTLGNKSKSNSSAISNSEKDEKSSEKRLIQITQSSNDDLKSDIDDVRQQTTEILDVVADISSKLSPKDITINDQTFRYDPLAPEGKKVTAVTLSGKSGRFASKQETASVQSKVAYLSNSLRNRKPPNQQKIERIPRGSERESIRQARESIQQYTTDRTNREQTTTSRSNTYKDYIQNTKSRTKDEKTLRYGGKGVGRAFLFGAVKGALGEGVASKFATTFRNKSQTEEAYRNLSSNQSQRNVSNVPGNTAVSNRKMSTTQTSALQGMSNKTASELAEAEQEWKEDVLERLKNIEDAVDGIDSGDGLLSSIMDAFKTLAAALGVGRIFDSWGGGGDAGGKDKKGKKGKGRRTPTRRTPRPRGRFGVFVQGAKNIFSRKKPQPRDARGRFVSRNPAPAPTPGKTPAAPPTPQAPRSTPGKARVAPAPAPVTPAPAAPAPTTTPSGKTPPTPPPSGKTPPTPPPAAEKAPAPKSGGVASKIARGVGAASGGSTMGGAAKVIGGVGTAVAVGTEVYAGYSEYQDIDAQKESGEITESEATVQKSEVVGETAGRVAGGLAGAAVGGKAGAATGAAIAAFLTAPIGGIGAPIGAIIGGIVGAGVGYFVGSEVAGAGGSVLGEAIGEELAIDEYGLKKEDIPAEETELYEQWKTWVEELPDDEKEKELANAKASYDVWSYDRKRELKNKLQIESELSAIDIADKMGIPVKDIRYVKVESGVPVVINDEKVPAELYTEDQQKKLEERAAGPNWEKTFGSEEGGKTLGKDIPDPQDYQEWKDWLKTLSPESRQLQLLDPRRSYQLWKSKKDVISTEVRARELAGEMGLEIDPKTPIDFEYVDGIPTSIEETPVPAELYTDEERKKLSEIQKDKIEKKSDKLQQIASSFGTSRQSKTDEEQQVMTDLAVKMDLLPSNKPLEGKFVSGIPVEIFGKPVPMELYTEEQKKKVIDEILSSNDLGEKTGGDQRTQQSDPQPSIDPQSQRERTLERLKKETEIKEGFEYQDSKTGKVVKGTFVDGKPVGNITVGDEVVTPQDERYPELVARAESERKKVIDQLTGAQSFEVVGSSGIAVNGLDVSATSRPNPKLNGLAPGMYAADNGIDLGNVSVQNAPNMGERGLVMNQREMEKSMDESAVESAIPPQPIIVNNGQQTPPVQPTAAEGTSGIIQIRNQERSVSTYTSSIFDHPVTHPGIYGM